MTRLEPGVYLDLVRRALAEDVGSGDLTTVAIVPPELRARAILCARQSCVVAGLDVASAVFTSLDPTAGVTPLVADGDACEPNQRLLTIAGSARALLTAERTALNFLQRLSGVATLTRRFVDAASGRITVLDTRKTTPGWRALERHAVRCGGGTNHRFGLFDAILIKDNHIRIAGSIAEAVRRARAHIAGDPKVRTPAIEVEAQSLAQVDEAIAAGVETIMLDNLTATQMTEAIRRIAGRARVEVSGGVSLATMAEVAAVGADVVSIGALTHSAPAVDISMDLESDADRPSR